MCLAPIPVNTSNNASGTHALPEICGQGCPQSRWNYNIKIEIIDVEELYLCGSV